MMVVLELLDMRYGRPPWRIPLGNAHVFYVQTRMVIGQAPCGGAGPKKSVV